MALDEGRLPKEAHMVLKTRQNDYFLIREARILTAWKEEGAAYFKIRYRGLLYVDPGRYKDIIARSSFSWLGRHARRQLVYSADSNYENELRYVPRATGRVARFLFYNQIEQRVRNSKHTRRGENL